MSEKKVIVSGGDAAYFGMLDELVDSIRRFPESSRYDIAIMDAGLTPEQRKGLEEKKVVLFNADWPCPIAESRTKGREFLKACVCRPFINKFLPGYDLYIWLDSDTWVQDWEAIRLFTEGARTGKMSCTLLLDRAYPASERLKWFGPFPWKARGFYYANAKRAFSRKIARQLFHHHTVSAGAFGLRADAPHWARWQELVIKALQKGRLFTAEQLSLGVMIHIDGYQAELLPALCNWASINNLLWDSANKVFVEPYLPHERIYVLHLSGLDEMRRDVTVTKDVQTLDGRTIQMSLRFCGAVRDQAIAA